MSLLTASQLKEIIFLMEQAKRPNNEQNKRVNKLISILRKELTKYE